MQFRGRDMHCLVTDSSVGAAAPGAPHPPPEPHTLPPSRVLSPASQEVLWPPGQGALGFRLSEGLSSGHRPWQRMVRAPHLPQGQPSPRSGRAQGGLLCLHVHLQQQPFPGSLPGPPWRAGGCSSHMHHSAKGREAHSPPQIPFPRRVGSRHLCWGRDAEEDASFDFPRGSLPCWQCLWPDSGL